MKKDSVLFHKVEGFRSDPRKVFFATYTPPQKTDFH